MICDSSLDWLIPSWFSFIYCFGMLILPGFVFFGYNHKLADLENDLERFYGWSAIFFGLYFAF